MIITGKKFSKPTMSRVINGDIVLNGDEEKPEKFRLDHLLVEKYPDYNRSTLQKFIRAGYVTVNGQIADKPNLQFEKSATIDLNVPERQSTRQVPDPVVIYEDDHVKVVDKPAGLLSIAKGDYCSEPTLEDYGLLVHRLDRDTSGVVILAKDEETRGMLRRQFQERKAHKVYYAVVHGRPKLDEAKIDLPIARDRNHHTTFRVDPNGKQSTTFYKVVKSNDIYSLIELRPVTGRTHQLRVHLQYLGVPILGDRVYGDKDDQTRLFLHAHELEITIPGPTSESDNIRKTFSSPLPAEFSAFFEE